MVIDKFEHQKLLLELIKVSNFPGQILDLVVEVRKSIESAEITEKPLELREAR